MPDPVHPYDQLPLIPQRTGLRAPAVEDQLGNNRVPELFELPTRNHSEVEHAFSPLLDIDLHYLKLTQVSGKELPRLITSFLF